MKLNLGGGPKKIEGYLNVDVLPWEGTTDVLMDITETPWQMVSETVDEIVMVECLEHISFRKTDRVLGEIYRVLKKGGFIHIQVPDIREMMFAYWNGQICDCVPHKPDKDFKGADQYCLKCEGYGKVHPNRWLYAFLGAQKHEYDYHRNIFTPERLRECLENAGFDRIEFKADPLGWKIKVNCIK